MSFSSRIKQLLEYKQITLKELCEQCDIPYRTMQNYVYEEDRKINSDVLIKLNTYLGINLNWLLTGTGEMFGSKTAPRTQAIVEMIESLDDSQKQKIYNVIEDAKQLQEMKERIDLLLQSQAKKTA